MQRKNIGAVAKGTASREMGRAAILDPEIRWSWATRRLERDALSLDRLERRPEVGDLALFRVESLGYHKRVTVTDQSRYRLYPGDRFVGVFGTRYATDGYEGVVDDLDELHLLTGDGLVGTVRSRHRSMRRPTRIAFEDWIADGDGIVNLKQRLFHPGPVEALEPNLIFVVGTAMNSGKTTVMTMLIRGLKERGLRVASCKLTGSLSHRDMQAMISAGAVHVGDFSDHGFPSTAGSDRQELVSLFTQLVGDAQRFDPDVVLVEIADGILQRETELLINEPAILASMNGLVLAASCSSSALYGLHVFGPDVPVIGVSGVVTNAPLLTREIEKRSDVPVLSSRDGGKELAAAVIGALAP